MNITYIYCDKLIKRHINETSPLTPVPTLDTEYFCICTDLRLSKERGNLIKLQILHEKVSFP